MRMFAGTEPARTPDVGARPSRARTGASLRSAMPSEGKTFARASRIAVLRASTPRLRNWAESQRPARPESRSAPTKESTMRPGKAVRLAEGQAQALRGRDRRSAFASRGPCLASRRRSQYRRRGEGVSRCGRGSWSPGCRRPSRGTYASSRGLRPLRPPRVRLLSRRSRYRKPRDGRRGCARPPSA